MFRSARKHSTESLLHGKVESLIGEGTSIKGSIRSSGIVRVDGFLEGSIDHDGDLIIGPKARLQANVKARALAMAGEIRGDVEVEGKLELLPGANLQGDVRCGHLVIHEGARFHGRSIMANGDTDDAAESAASGDD